MRIVSAVFLAVVCLLSAVAAWPQQARDRLGDPLPAGAIQRLGTTRMKGNYSAHAYLPDGRGLLAIGTTLEIWDLDRGERLEALTIARSGIRSLRVSKDGSRLLFRDAADVVEWSLKERTELHRIDADQPGFTRPTYHSSSSVEYSPDETRVLTTGGLPPSLKEFDLATGRQLLSIDGTDALTGKRGQACFFTHGVYAPDGKTAFVVGGYDYCAAHFDLSTGEQLHRFLTGHHAYHVSVSADGERILVGSRSYASEWQIDGYKQLQRYNGGAPGSAYSHDPDEILTGTRNGEIRRWNRKTGELIMGWQRYYLPGETARFVTRLRVSPDGKHVLAYGRGMVTESSLETGRPRAAWDTHAAGVEAVAFLADGKRVASGSSDGTIRVWDAITGESLLTIKNPDAGSIFAFVAVCASPDGNRIAAGDYNGVIWEFAVADGSLIRKLEGHSGFVRALQYSADGRRLLSTADDGSARVWATDSAEPVAVLHGHRGGVLAAAWSPDGTQVATAGRDETVRLWDVAKTEELRKLEGHRSWVCGVGFADATTLVSAGADERIIRWDVNRGEPLAEMQQKARVGSLVVSADGTRAYAAGAGNVILGWDLTAAEQVGTWSGHQGNVTGLALSPDGSMLVSASSDSTLLVWKLP
jgi:WD40 repeat protein